MLVWMLMGLQSGVVDGDWTLPRAAGPDLHVSRRCPTSDAGGEVVVCGGRDPDRYRMKPLPQGFEKKGTLPLAQTGLGGGTVGVTTQQVMIGNIPSNRVMVSLKLPF